MKDRARLPASDMVSSILRRGGFWPVPSEAEKRRAGVGAILASGSRGLRGQLRQANALEIPYALILGDDEIQRGEVVIRDMGSSTQEARQLDQFLGDLAGS